MRLSAAPIADEGTFRIEHHAIGKSHPRIANLGRNRVLAQARPHNECQAISGGDARFRTVITARNDYSPWVEHLARVRQTGSAQSATRAARLNELVGP